MEDCLVLRDRSTGLDADGSLTGRRSPAERVPDLCQEPVGRFFRQLEDDETGERDGVTDHLGQGDGGTHDHDRADDEENVLDDTGERQHERACAADQEDDGNVKGEGSRGVPDQDWPPDQLEDVLEGRTALEERNEEEVEPGADRRKLWTGTGHMQRSVFVRSRGSHRALKT